MGSLSIWHWVIIIAVVALLFGGKGKVSDLMGDVAKGIKSFKKGLSDEDEQAKSLQANAEQAVNKASDKVKG
jgi:sec-independent protein translocase protein TatA